MKCVIFAGGLGNRIKTSNDETPKPLLTIGENPIIWHIIKIYQSYGIKDFIICLGYKQEMFKKYFINQASYENDICISYKNGEIKTLNNDFSDLNISLINTGKNTLTGGRLKRVEKYLENEENFLLTYGDAVSDVNISKLIEYHNEKKKLVTITAVKRKENFGVLKLDEENNICDFSEKKATTEYINAGFMVVNKKVLDYLEKNSASFEKEVLEKLVKENQLSAYTHNGFWQCMDNQHQREMLKKMIEDNEAPWISWE